jgi:hypothetical protein
MSQLANRSIGQLVSWLESEFCTLALRPTYQLANVPVDQQ